MPALAHPRTSRTSRTSVTRTLDGSKSSSSLRFESGVTWFNFPIKTHPRLVPLNVCGSLILRMGDFLCFAGTNFCDWKTLVFLVGNYFFAILH